VSQFYIPQKSTGHVSSNSGTIMSQDNTAGKLVMRLTDWQNPTRVGIRLVSIIGIVMDCTTKESTFNSQQGKNISVSSKTSRSDLGPSQPPIQWVPGDISPGVKLITQPRLVLKSRTGAAPPPLLHKPSWFAQGQIYLYLFITVPQIWSSSNLHLFTQLLSGKSGQSLKLTTQLLVKWCELYL
jgi:hypothetical protein